MRRTLPILVALAVAAACVPGGATTYNTPSVDGHVTRAPLDWDADEWGVDDPIDDGRWYPSDPDLDDLYVTWDADSLYVGITTDRVPGMFGNGYLLFIDTDAQNDITGATDFGSADFYRRRITFSTMGADVIVAGWNLPRHFDVRHCSDPTSTSPVDGVHTEARADSQHVEAALSWSGLFGLGPGRVPPGTRLRFIAAVVGGDDSGAYDAMPTSSTGAESNPATAWDAYTDLDNYYEVLVDFDRNGVPDAGYPPDGAISGLVSFDDAGDAETVATVTAYVGGAPVKNVRTAPGGGAYTLDPLYDSDYEIVATAYSYLDSTRFAAVVGGVAVTGVDFLLRKVEGAIEGEVALSGGPSVDVVVTAYDSETGNVAGDGAQTVPGGTGPFRISTVLDGAYRVEAFGKGYEEETVEAVVANEDTAEVGLLTLPAVVATKYAFVDSAGSTILGVGTTVSLPADSVYYYAAAWIEPRDDDDRTAYWDGAAQDSVRLQATKLDPHYPAEGSVILADAGGTELPGSMLTAAMFDDARAPFAVASDSVQVLRVLASRGALEGVLEVGIDAPAPTRLTLSSDEDTIEAGAGSARIVGQLIDAAGNDAKIPGVLVGMTAAGAGGQFSLSSLETDANGRFELDFSGTTSGTALVTAIIDPSSVYAALDVDVLPITVEPGEAALVQLRTDSPELRLGQSATLTAQVADGWGNPVALAGLSIALTATPSHLLAVLESPIETGPDGSANAAVTAGAAYGIVEISGAAGSIHVEAIFLPIDATFVESDEKAPESDEDHNSLDGVDLTIMRAANGLDELVVTLDFASSWSGVHVILALETRGDAAGGSIDPFGFPVYYGHGLLPDYVFTYKYAYDDGPYADLRKYEGGQWWHYDFVNEEWRIGWAEGVNAVEQGFVAKDAEQVEFRLPLSVIDAGVGDAVRLEAYVTQQDPPDDSGQKRTALDSVPSDATHDMDPDTGEWWETATTPVTLSNYATYVVREEAPSAPLLGNAAADPSVARPGDLVTYTVEVTDSGGGMGDVFVDLSSLGGSVLSRMLDDGVFPDVAPSDGVYSAADTLGRSAANGDHTVRVTARDASNVSKATLDLLVTVDNPAVALRSFGDTVGDDHGPNQTDQSGNGVEGLYYEYPTNFVFRPGSFDLTGVEIFANGNWLVFRVRIDDLVNHQDPGSADWGADEPDEQFCDDPYRTDLNLQKIDIYIDAREGEGATSGFPKRYVDIAAVDAWDYGIAVEGWGKWLVVSNGENSTASWGLFKNSDEIVLCDNHAEDYIDISVDRELLGLSAAADTAALRRAIGAWDIIVCMSSHDQDGDPEDQILGGIRRVNANTSEWQIGGGRDEEGGRERDANIMDLVVSAGAGHESGRSQQEMLDYTTPEAMDRFASDQVACVLEASFAVDTSPPIVEPFVGDPDVRHIPWMALDGAPAVIFTAITDVTGVDRATFYWHPVGIAAAVDSVRMVNLAADLWAADIPREDIVAHTNVVELSKTGEARVIVGWIRAVDSSPAENTIRTAAWEFGVMEPWALSQVFEGVDSLLPLPEDERFIFQDGTILVLEAGLPAVEGELDLVLEPIRENLLDLSNIRDDMAFAGVARAIRLRSGEGETVPLGWPAWLWLHYQERDVASLSEEKLGIFSWVDETERWVLTGGAPNPAGNTVLAVGIEDLGVFGVFHWDQLGGGDGRGLSGVLAEPNPFSPNGDGLYEETTVTFYLGREADYVNIEFYDLTGRLARRLVFQEATNYSGRTPVMVTWDGTDQNGNVVPYGIYVMRVEAKFKTEPTFERVNRPVVVIK